MQASILEWCSNTTNTVPGRISCLEGQDESPVARDCDAGGDWGTQRQPKSN